MSSFLAKVHAARSFIWLRQYTTDSGDLLSGVVFLNGTSNKLLLLDFNPATNKLFIKKSCHLDSLINLFPPPYDGVPEFCYHDVYSGYEEDSDDFIEECNSHCLDVMSIQFRINGVHVNAVMLVLSEHAIRIKPIVFSLFF